MPRLFVALELPSEVQRGLAGVSAGAAIGSARWVAPTNIHMTLRFLGDYPHDKAEMVKSVLVDAAAEAKAYYMRLGGFGAFPSPKNARVFWLGVRDGKAETGALQKRIETQLIERGFPAEDRAFHPHVTLARIKQREDIRMFVDELNRGFTLPGPILIKDVVLFESVLKPSGAEYRALVRAPLAPSG